MDTQSATKSLVFSAKKLSLEATPSKHLEFLFFKLSKERQEMTVSAIKPFYYQAPNKLSRFTVHHHVVHRLLISLLHETTVNHYPPPPPQVIQSKQFTQLQSNHYPHPFSFPQFSIFTLHLYFIFSAYFLLNWLFLLISLLIIQRPLIHQQHSPQQTISNFLIANIKVNFMFFF